jgi:hypothetical protein
MTLKIKDMAPWLGIVVGFCPIAAVALRTYAGAQRSVLVGALSLGFIVLNIVGLVLGLRKKDKTALSPVKASFIYGLMVGVVVAGVIWLNAP